MTSLTSKDAEPKTGVLWDVEDCPILNGLDPKSIYDNIKLAIGNKGYHGEVIITAYKEKKPIRNDFELAGIKLKIEGNKRGRFNAMFNDMYTYKWETGSNLMIISRDKTKYTPYLDGSKANLLFAEPANLPENCCKCGIVLDKEPIIKPIKNIIISDEWVWTSLAFGGDPITKIEKQESGVNSNHDSDSESESELAIGRDPITKTEELASEANSNSNSDSDFGF